jgi:membrane protein implicated in regulation of membrane protease activity
MEAFFLVLFLTGVALAVLSVLAGLGHIGVHMPHLQQAHLPNLHLGGSHTGDIAPVNATTITAFLAWCGGIGFILTSATNLPVLLIVPLAALAGTFGASLVAFFLIRVLLPGQTLALRPEDYRIEGTLGRLTMPIGPGGTGEVVYDKRGVTRSNGARSADGTPLPRGTEVVILRYERGMAYVEPLDQLLAAHTPLGAERL